MVHSVYTRRLLIISALSPFGVLTLTVGWVIWPVKPVPNMTTNGTLNLTQSNPTSWDTNSRPQSVSGAKNNFSDL